MKIETVYLEHANISVNKLDEAIRFFQAAFPDFTVRGAGESNGRKWIHLGNERTYLAFNEAFKIQHHEKDYLKNGINHLGFVVSNVEVIAERLLTAGFKRDYPKQVEKYRIRDYFLDADGNEFEFVEYLSNDVSERNFYDA